MKRSFGSDSAVPSSDGEAPTRIVAVDAIGRGMVLAGKYEVDRVLGQGGMGVVVAAKNLDDGNRVALKFLIDEAAKDPEAVERFHREARAASQIPNDHVTRVLDMGRLDSGAPFIVMELLQGRDLGYVLEENKELPIATAVDYVLQVLEALGAAHLIGIVHRDLKPANLFLTTDASGQPLVKVLDFGLSKDLSSHAAFSLTQSSTGAMGTPLYMAPEQVKSAKHATFASDIWSMGVVIHELVSGDVPFDGPNLGALLGAILSEPPKPLRASRPSAPPGLEAVVLRCLEKDQRKRPRDALELANLLAPFASAAGAASAERIRIALQLAGRPTIVDERTTMKSPPESRSESPRARPRWAFSSDPAKQRGRSALAATLVSVIGLVGAWTIVRARPAERTVGASRDEVVAPPASVPVAPVPAPHPESTAVGEPVVSGEPSASVSMSPSASGTPSASAKTPRPRANAAPEAPASKPSAGSPSLEDQLKRGRR